jgi:hypothetical protein
MGEMADFALEQVMDEWGEDGQYQQPMRVKAGPGHNPCPEKVDLSRAPLVIYEDGWIEMNFDDYYAALNEESALDSEFWLPAGCDEYGSVE